LYECLDYSIKIDPEIIFLAYLYHAKSLNKLKKFEESKKILETSLEKYENIHEIIKGDSLIALHEALEGLKDSSSQLTLIKARNFYSSIQFISGYLRTEFKIISNSLDFQSNCQKIQEILSGANESSLPRELRIRFLILGCRNCFELSNLSLAKVWHTELLGYFPLKVQELQQYSELAYNAYFCIATFFFYSNDFHNAQLAIEQSLSLQNLLQVDKQFAEHFRQQILEESNHQIISL
jgi:hypothetical protein